MWQHVRNQELIALVQANVAATGVPGQRSRAINTGTDLAQTGWLLSGGCLGVAGTEQCLSPAGVVGVALRLVEV